MFYSSLSPRTKSRVWIAHGDPLPGFTREALHDHDDVRRFGGSFVRPLYCAEALDDARQCYEMPFAVISPTCDPKTIKRSFRAVHVNKAPFPDYEDAEPEDDFHRAVTSIDPTTVQKWRRL